MTPISTITFIGLIISFLLTIMKEFFSAKERSRQRNEKFEMDKQKFIDFADNALVKLRHEIKEENRRARDLEDQIDNEIKK